MNAPRSLELRRGPDRHDRSADPTDASTQFRRIPLRVSSFAARTQKGAPGMAGRPSGIVGLPGIAVLLVTVFTVLRLTHRISWSWWWVLSPLWGLGGILVLIFAGIVITGCIDILVSRKNRRKAPAGSSRRRQGPCAPPPE
jgi:hypothetical protein